MTGFGYVDGEPFAPRDSSRYVANTMDAASKRIDDALAAHISAMDDFITRLEGIFERSGLGGLLDRLASENNSRKDSSGVLRRDGQMGHPTGSTNSAPADPGIDRLLPVSRTATGPRTHGQNANCINSRQ